MKVLTDALVEFDPDFYPNTRSKSQIRKIPKIEELLSSPEHFRLSDYTLHYILCGKEVPRICIQIGRILRTLEIDVGGYNFEMDEISCKQYY